MNKSIWMDVVVVVVVAAVAVDIVVDDDGDDDLFDIVSHRVFHVL